MATPSITIENLSKRYRLGGTNVAYRTLRDVFSRRRGERVPATELWALRDVSFDIEQGEVIGLIGHNGAGKSTLLKILSRITEPTGGRAILRGRVASLLEIGTGFHPELTGRENVFLNGAILGMSRAEIRRDFDAIVAFAEIERFLDTPVKRYSSGMYVRLAFAVAAHLTPEILLVDEVLAVGDADFQRRCLGRMNEVARSGRTVVFVSHNLVSIESLCPRAVLLSRGTVAALGESRDVIAQYLSKRGKSAMLDLRAAERLGAGRARFTGMELLTAGGEAPMDELPFGTPFRVRLHYDVFERIPGASFGFALVTNTGGRIFITESFERGPNFDLDPGSGSIDCIVDRPSVLPGTYRFEIWVSDIPGLQATDHLTSIGEVEIVAGDETRGGIAMFTAGVRGLIHVDSEWGVPR